MKTIMQYKDIPIGEAMDRLMRSGTRTGAHIRRHKYASTYHTHT